MKETSLILLILIAALAVPSCKNMEEGTDMVQIQQLKDTVFKSYPTVASIFVDVAERKDLVVVLGDAKLYKMPIDAQQHEANEIGILTLRLFGKDNSLEKGKLIVTKDLKNSKENPDDGIIIPINIDSLKKVVYPK